MGADRLRLAAAGCFVVAALLWYPLRNAAAYSDDYLFVALGHLDSPWPLLLGDSVGSFFFRPLVMFIWWFTDQAFGANAALHYAFNMAVHAVNGVLLAVLLSRLRVSTTVAVLAALAFVAHPTTFQAAAWLCIRFDLFAVTFGLAGLIAVERYLAAPSGASFAAAVGCIAASIFSKETGFGMAAVAVLAIGWPGGVASRKSRLALAAAIVAVVVVGLGVRPFVLRHSPETEALLGQGVTLILRGTWKWIEGAPGFFVVHRGGVAAIAAWIAAVALLAAAFVYAAATKRLGRPGLAKGAFLALAILASSVIAPATIVGQIPLPSHRQGDFDVGALLSSRFYYMPWAAVAMLLAAAGEALRSGTVPRGVRLAVGFSFALAIVGLVATSRNVGRDFAAHTESQVGLYERAALASLATLPAPAPGCKVYLLDIPERAFHFREMADTAVKQFLPRGDARLACFIQAEHAPWYHLVADGHLPARAYEPLEIIAMGGKPFPPLRLGNLTYYYLRIPDSEAVRSDPNATFLAFENGRFRDVTAEVRAGTRKPKFFDNRPQR